MKIKNILQNKTLLNIVNIIDYSFYFFICLFFIIGISIKVSIGIALILGFYAGIFNCMYKSLNIIEKIKGKHGK